MAAAAAAAAEEVKVPKVIDEEIGTNPFFKGKHRAELKEAWLTGLPDTANYHFRDSLVDEMLRRGVEPHTWMRDRDTSLGLYPDVEDPEFASRLYKKAEFASLSSKAVSEDTCGKSRQLFETTAVQRLVARFLHPTTPYRGLLLDHGVGVGKTCSAVTVAETYLEIMPHNTVFILAPQAIAQGFKNTIFNIDRVKPADSKVAALTGDKWQSQQCTGMTYLRLSETAGAEKKEEIERAVAPLVRRRYKIMGYLAFANYVLGKVEEAVPAHIVGVAREDMINAKLMEMFSDHLIIVDEAHNLRDASAAGGPDEPDAAATNDAAEGKKLTPVLRRILAVSEGTRLMLMTATPMYNTAPEILFLLNLLILNDTKDSSKELTLRKVFRGDDSFEEGGEELLARHIRRYVSYMRGENPNTFPLRLTPPEKGGDEFMAEYPEVSISRREGTVNLTETDVEIMSRLPLIVHTVDEDTMVGRTLTRYLSENAKPRPAKKDKKKKVAAVDAPAVDAPEEEVGEASEISDFVLDQTMQIGNMVYPDGTFGRIGWGNYFKAHNVTRGSTATTEYEWIGEDEDVEDVFGPESIYEYAPKISAIVESITAAKGISFVYSRYVLSGALPLAIALELAGWCRVLSDGTPAPLLRRAAGAPKPKYFYVLLTSNKEVSPDFKGLLEYATTFKTGVEAATGSKVKAIIGSQVASEGLDLKCIRELHLLDGWYHLNRIEQIEGRGVRFCSHVMLPQEHRNCLIYLHVVNVPPYESADLYAYRLAVRKAQPIGRVTRLMKINAWDCMLNRDAILLHDLGTRAIVDAQGRRTEEYELADQPYTSFCDFSDVCEYVCAGKPVKAKAVGKNTSTYKEFDFRRVFAEKQLLLENLFGAEGVVAEPLGKIRDTVFEDMPWSIAAIGLRNMLGSIRIHRTDGINGTLILQNGYLVFQPDKVTDTEIPLAMRYGRAYGRLPRSIMPSRGTVFGAAAPALPVEPEAAAAAAAAAAETGVADEASLRAKALSGLAAWSAIVEEMMSTESGPIAAPEGFADEAFNGWRWVLNHFADLPETPLIAARWWMDNLWTAEEKIAVFSDWVKRYEKLKADEKAWADLYTPSEIFISKAIRGFQVYDTSEKRLKFYCITRKSPEPEECPSTLLGDVNALIDAPVDRIEDTSDVFGFLVTKVGTTVFKTVHKPTAEGSLLGSECSNDSVLKHHHPRIITALSNLSDLAPRDPLLRLTLDYDEDTKPTNKEKERVQKAVKARFEGKKGATDDDFTHLHFLSLRQVCPYMEFILRYMDMKRIGRWRWFLSLAESARALPGGKKAVKMT